MTDSEQRSNSTPSTEHSRTGWASDRELATHYSVSRATIWRWVNEGKLPKPVKLSAGVTRWRWSETPK